MRRGYDMVEGSIGRSYDEIRSVTILSYCSCKSSRFYSLFAENTAYGI